MAIDNKDLEPINMRCGHCGNHRKHEVLLACRDQEVRETDPWSCEVNEHVLRVSRCPFCERINFSAEDTDDGEMYILYPNLTEPLKGLPSKIASAYRAAQAVRTIDANAYSVLVGRVLELVCSDRKARGDTLFKQLNDLAGRQEIPGPLAAMADQLRELRNIGAHALAGNLTDGEVPTLDTLCRAVLEYVYVAPSRVEQVRKQIDRLKKQER